MAPTNSIKAKIRTIPDFPKKGIQFRDITTLLLDPDAFRETIDLLFDHYRDTKIDCVAGIEARGFIIGAALAYRLGTGFVPVRKKGKLPGKTIEYSYELEYGTDSIEIHDDALQKGQNVLLIDDLLATGGTAIAAAGLIEKAGGKIANMAFVIDLPDVGGKKKLKEAGYSYYALCEFEGD
jgi:adenine phosphoribosyltransferase